MSSDGDSPQKKDIEIPTKTATDSQANGLRSPTLSETSSEKGLKSKPDLLKSNTILFPVKSSSRADLKSLFSWSTDIETSTADDQIARTFRDASIDFARRDLAKKLWFRVFLLTTFLVTIGEAITVGFLPRKIGLGFQFALLAAGTALQIFELVVVYNHIEIEGSNNQLLLLVELFDHETILNVVCIIFGWCTIAENPGVSVLRCLRCFRLLWYLELFTAEEEFEAFEKLVFKLKDAIQNAQFVGLNQLKTRVAPETEDEVVLEEVLRPDDEKPFSFVLGCQLCLLYLERLFQELFTAKSQGATVVLGLWFFISYIFSIVFWIDFNVETSNPDVCSSLNNCFVTLIRLSLYDGGGLDYMQAVMNAGFYGYTLVLMIYLIVTSIILLNGLIGIFGKSFSDDDDDSQKNDHHWPLKKLSKAVHTHVKETSLKDLVVEIFDLDDQIKKLSDEKKYAKANEQEYLDDLKNHPLDYAYYKLTDTKAFKTFIFCTASVAMLECVIVGFPPHGWMYRLQWGLLSAATALQMFEIVLLFNHIEEGLRDEMQKNYMKFISILGGGIYFNIVFILFGWWSLGIYRGLAALRCFRVIRLVWYVELLRDETDASFVPEDNLFTPVLACRLCLVYIRRILREVFSAASKGAIVVLVAFFFITYIFAVIFWVDLRELSTPQDFFTQQCRSLNNCFITMFRLALYDGNAFDFLQTAMNRGYHAYAFLMFLYLIFAAIILLNGLIGIFGNAFSTDREIIYSSEDQATMNALSAELEDLSIKDISKRILTKKLELRELTERNLRNIMESSRSNSKII